jgi:hypothetical protein
MSFIRASSRLQKIRWNKDFCDCGKRLCGRADKEICTLRAYHFAPTLIKVSVDARGKNFAQMTADERRESSESIKFERISAK